MTSYLRPDTKISDNRRSKFRFGHSHRAVRTIEFAPADCTEPHVTGANILRDPGFESGGDNGSLATRIPMTDNTPELFYPDIQYSDNSGTPAAPVEGYTPTLGWTADLDWHTTGRYHEHSTAAPRTGTYHVQSNTYGENPVFDALWVVGGEMCISGDARGWYSAIVKPGDIITWSMFSRRTGSSGTLENHWQLFFYDNTATFISSDTGNFLLDLHISAYQAYSHNTVAPANAHYLTASIDAQVVSGTPSSDTRVYHDDMVLSIV